MEVETTTNVMHAAMEVLFFVVMLAQGKREKCIRSQIRLLTFSCRAFHIDCCPLPLDRNNLPDKWFCHQCILEIQNKPNDPNLPFLKGDVRYSNAC